MRRRSRAALLATAALAGACNRMPGRPGPGSVEVRPDRVTDFAILYRENCGACHGSDGVGNGAAMGLANPVYLAVADDAVLARAASDGVHGTAMPAFARRSGGFLTDRQIAILVSGIRAWAKPAALRGAVPPPYAATAAGGDAMRGAAVYAGACASCHGPNGTGGPKGGSIVDGSYLGLVSDQSLRTTIIAGRPDLGHPDWRGDGGRAPLTDADVADVVAWLSAQRPAAPGAPYPEPAR